jgi:hypothetical protein
MLKPKHMQSDIQGQNVFPHSQIHFYRKGANIPSAKAKGNEFCLNWDLSDSEIKGLWSESGFSEF